jgi:two-component system alkaline phosphatase synthesis response regulator PhoP
VDDDAAMRALCRESLEAAGFRVLEASDGDEALVGVKVDRPDVVLLDIVMPRVSGWTVAADLLSEESADKIPIIFISARTARADRIRALELGAQDYVAKPFDPGNLAETITTVLDQIESGERDAALVETLTSLRAQQTLDPASE